jgi:L-ascorbate metabolism protein UlaG (beta-lactamase superfamily)
MMDVMEGGRPMLAPALTVALLAACFVGVVLAQPQPEGDVVATDAGDLRISFVGHASLVFTFGGKVVHVDPYGKLADYSRQPKADIVLITHDHFDHLDAAALRLIRTETTAVIAPPVCAPKVRGATIMKNGDRKTVLDIAIEAVPACNLVHKRDDGQPFHPRGAGNGYVLTFGGRRVYVAGDTENTPEMKALKDIAVAFLPMNLPYTMTPEMVADAARAFRPRILYPYHYGDTDPSKLQALLKDLPEVDVRIRPMR